MKNKKSYKHLKYKYFIKTKNTNINLLKTRKVYNIKKENDEISFYTNNINGLDETYQVFNIWKETFNKIIKNYCITLIGILILIITVYIISKSITEIEFSNETYDAEIYSYIQSEIKYYGKIGFLKRNIKSINNDLRKTYYMYQWINIEKKGTVIIINLTKADTDNLINNENNQGYLISYYDAYIKGYYVKKGKILVSPNTTVGKGDKLISGYIPLYGGEEELVIPEGYVIGEVSYLKTYYLDNNKVISERSGRLKKQRVYIWFNKEKDLNCHTFNEYEVEKTEIISIGNFLKVYDIYYYEVINSKISYTENSAIQYGKSLIYSEFDEKKKYDFEKIVSIEVNNITFSNNKIILTFAIKMIKDITT